MPLHVKFVLGEGRDAQFFDNIEKAEIVSRLQAAQDSELALWLTLTILDPSLPALVRVNSAKALNPLIAPPSPQPGEPLLRYKRVGDVIRGIMFAAPLPDARAGEVALELCRSVVGIGWVQGLLADLITHQDDIRKVCDAWTMIPESLFRPVGNQEQAGGALDGAPVNLSREEFRAIAVREGLFNQFTFVTNREMPEPFIDESLESPLLRGVAGGRAVLEAWATPLRLARRPPTGAGAILGGGRISELTPMPSPKYSGFQLGRLNMAIDTDAFTTLCQRLAGLPLLGKAPPAPPWGNQPTRKKIKAAIESGQSALPPVYQSGYVTPLLDQLDTVMQRTGNDMEPFAAPVYEHADAARSGRNCNDSWL
jgi:hypothetical protein